MSVRRPARAARRGGTTVEAALVLGVVFLFLIGILEYGRYLFMLHTATNATSRAARWASARTAETVTATDIVNETNTYMADREGDIYGYTVSVFAAQPGVSPPTPVSGAQWNDASFGSGICVRITGSYRFVAFGLLSVPISIPVNISSVVGSEAN